MPARVTYFISDDAALPHHHLHAKPSESSSSSSASSSSSSSGKMPKACIAVRPPSRAQAHTLLSPPVVAKLTSKKCSSGIHFFTTAVLLDSHGDVAHGLLDGTTAVTGVLLDSSTMIFAFGDLSIAAEGCFTIRLDVYGMYPESTEGATLIAQLETTEIAVYEGPVPSQRPCKHIFRIPSNLSHEIFALVVVRRRASLPLSRVKHAGWQRHVG